ncbi:hypothetical protein [Arthrobacter sp. PAMC25284]|uniref:AMIN-like domain-containing (lipo)protein n=1 Tax=Arthrobacter sp. PAMC25284 TaxID=2861279 RepID=UPI001C62A4F1|nr:hypothetical protein [Arthrobacter sp. PAMC25284]QYF89398.1 hypothetical protein KY499_15085 [Arthrobacter sp. PAMC25284]
MPKINVRAIASTVAVRNAGLGTLAFLLVLTACTASPPEPGAGTASSGTAAASETATASTTPATASPVPSATSTGPGEWDERVPPLAGDMVIASKVTHEWAWPGAGAFQTTHENPVPIAPPPAAPLPTLYSIGSGQHPANTPPYDQLSFRFEGGFPGYDIEVVPQLIADGSGEPIPMPNTGSILEVAFRGAQAHTADGSASSVTSAPPAAIGYVALTKYASAGDFEGVVSYGIGIGRPLDVLPETKVRVVEVEKIEQGKHLYVVAIQFDRTSW